MFRLLLFILLASNLFATSDRLPQIVCRDARGKSFPLDLERFAMDIAIQQDLAETTLTLTFRNNTSRQLEGDFLLPLPAHANISGYALQVQGQFREAVAVEKERAKLAYETIKRRGIDPGIVEKVANNLYRTRIFPIEPHSTKSLRISYLEHLAIDSPAPCHPTYRYPFHLTSPVGEISVNVTNSPAATIRHPALQFQQTQAGGMRAVLTNQTLAGELTIESNTPHQSQLLLSQDQRLSEDKRAPKTAYLTLNSNSIQRMKDTLRQPFAPVWPAPKKVQILWDASRSLLGTDFSKVSDYLEAFFQKSPNITVQLVLLRNKATTLAPIQISNGDWSQLQNTLQAIEYDGASAFPNLPEHLQDQELTLLITDGAFTSEPPFGSRATLNNPVVALLTGSHRNSFLQNLTHQSGGQTLPLAEMTTAAALAQTFQKSFYIRSSQYGVKVTLLPSHAPHLYRYLLTGHAIDPAKIQVAFGQRERHQLDLKTSTAPSARINRLSAIATLRLLEEQHAPPADIIAHCKEHTLASDYTSLIVLERFADHLTFRIPPPEPELLAKYQQKLREKDSRGHRHLKQVWAKTLSQHRYDFPGFEVSILHERQRLRTFQHAQQTVFIPEQLDPAVTKALSDWVQKADLLLAKSETHQHDDNWLQASRALNNEASHLADLRAAPKDSFSVSIRGFVKSPGTFQFDQATTLRDAIKRSEPFSRDYLSRVALYRSGCKTTYNTLSKKYEDIPLLPGDMIVLEERDYDSWGFSDPFSDNGSALNAHSEGPAIISPPSQRTATNQPITLSQQDPDGASPLGAHPAAKTQASLLNPVPIALHAIALHKGEHIEEATQHLSNLSELFGRNIAALRLEAFVRASWGEWKAAVKIYRQILVENPEDSLTTRLLANLLIAQDNIAAASATYQNFLDSLTDRKSTLAAAILLLDRNQLVNNLAGSTELSRLPKDLRIVVSNLHPDPSFRLSIADPTGCLTHHHQVSPTGIILTPTIGLYQISDREAIKGNYQLTAQCERDQLLEVTVYRNFATEKETVTTKTIKLPASATGKGTLLESIQID